MEYLKKKIQVAVDALKNQRFKEAENLTKKLIKENSNIVFLYNLLGLTLTQQGKFEQALESYEKGIKVDPKFAMIYNNLGLLYSHQKNDFIKAEKYYKKSIDLNQKIPEPYNNLATVYKSTDRLKEAIESYNKAIEINPKFVHAYHNLGNIYLSQGKFEQAKKNFEQAIEIDPSYSDAHRTLSRLINYSDNNSHFLKLKNLYKKINLDHKINLGFALGKAYEDIKNYEKSFKFYDEANSIYNKKTNFSMDRENEKFDKIKKTFDKELFEKYKDCGLIDSSPIFILGMPRSGTTLIEQILSSHPDVFGGDEQIFIPTLINNNFGNKDFNLYFSNIINFKKENFRKIGEDYISSMKNLSKDSLRFTDKFPENFLWIGFIKLILPKSKIIHCFRNSKDNCISLFKNHFPDGRINYSYNLDTTVEYYNKYYDLMNHWNKIFPDFIFNIKYEKLISETENELKKLLKFCDLSWNNKCLNFHDNKRVIKTASDVQARHKIYSSSINSWKNFEKFVGDKFQKLKS